MFYVEIQYGCAVGRAGWADFLLWNEVYRLLVNCRTRGGRESGSKVTESLNRALNLQKTRAVVLDTFWTGLERGGAF